MSNQDVRELAARACECDESTPDGCYPCGAKAILKGRYDRNFYKYRKLNVEYVAGLHGRIRHMKEKSDIADAVHKEAMEKLENLKVKARQMAGLFDGRPLVTGGACHCRWCNAKTGKDLLCENPNCLVVEVRELAK